MIDTELSNINPFLFSNLVLVRLEGASSLRHAVDWTLFSSLMTNGTNENV